MCGLWRFDLGAPEESLLALTGARIETYDDHRMAMSFALAGLAVPGVVIEKTECTAKTYPRFFDDLSDALGRPAARPV